jgi:hypothetical protein
MALLPRVRPKLGSYGRPLKNERPVRNAELEADANDYNNLRDDLAFIGAMTPVARLKVINDGATASLASSVGVDSSLVTTTRLAVGHVRVELAPAVGVVVVEAGGWAYGPLPAALAVAVLGPSIVDVHTHNASGPVDLAFTLMLF